MRCRRLYLNLEGGHFTDWLPAALDWLTSIGKPLLVGLPLLAMLFSAIGYIAVRWAWRWYVIVRVAAAAQVPHESGAMNRDNPATGSRPRANCPRATPS